MKKIIALLLALTMLLGLAACGSKPTETPAEEPAVEAPAEQPAEKPAEQPAEEPAEEPAPAEKKVISYWAQWSENETQAAVLKQARVHRRGQLGRP